MRPTLRQLEYALAVAEHGHFGRAAKACGVSQPGLSSQLGELESLLGIRIFERSSRRVVVTSGGQRVLEAARAVLLYADQLVEVSRALREPLTGSLRLGVIPTVSPYFLPQVMSGVRSEFPKLQLLLREEQTHSLVEQLRDGRLDAIIAALPLRVRDFEEELLYREPFLLAVGAAHRLARRPKARVATSELRDQDVLLLDDGHCLRGQALEVCARAGAREAGGLHATSLSTLVQMVANGLGVTLLPESAAALEARASSDIVLRRFADPEPGRAIGLAWRRASPRAAEYRLLASSMRRQRALARRSESKRRRQKH